MSRYSPDRNLEPVFSAAEYWREEALLGQRSVLSDKALWTNQHIDELQRFYVENLDEGEGNFMGKMQSQIAQTSAGAKQLMAEMTWFMLLCPSNIGPDNKRENIEMIWSWSGEPFPANSPYLRDDVLTGVGSAGTAFNTHRWREVVFFVEFLRAFRSLDSSKQRGLLADGWAMAEWMQTVEDADNRQLRHMILFLLFPDTFERILGRTDKNRLIESFTDTPMRKIREMTALEQDREIQQIRREQVGLFSDTELDFYVSPLIEKWSKARVTPPSKKKQKSDFEKATEPVQRRDVLAVLNQIDESGYPPDARSSTYDLIDGSNRYPPKYVLSLAVEEASGEAFPRSFFSGGEDSAAFRLLRELGFSIERKDFTRELISDFLSQADEAQDLKVSSYPKSYRGLKVNVSFGKGNLARIPWISYTGYGQATSEGIYPCVLYYKSAGVLLVCYGISQSNKSSVNWGDLGDAPTVADYLQSKFSTHAERYGSSFVHKGFDLREDVDHEGIEQAIEEVIGQYQELFSERPEPPVDPNPPPYDIAEALRELFIDEGKFEEILQLLKDKKNLILQGAPGVGKTFACKRLAYTLMGEQAKDRVQMVQFHQSYSYEDFIQGYRPTGTGFRLKNGTFFEFCDTARNDITNDYVFIIDELNRGNLSKVFGELMMLIEKDKRGEEWAIPLAYAEEDSPPFWIPENLYLIGLMNTADRSLAMVDYALRRRFAFATLEPGFETEQFFEFLTQKGATREFVAQVVERMVQLNRKISEDTTNLGPGFQIGHSFFCALPDDEVPDWPWYERVIRSEIAPLIDEYYFDAPQQAATLVEGLLRRG